MLPLELEKLRTSQEQTFLTTHMETSSQPLRDLLQEPQYEAAVGSRRYVLKKKVATISVSSSWRWCTTRIIAAVT
jgi:hypothetical protein